MSTITLTRVYEVLVSKLGKEATESLISFNESKIKSEMENICKQLATKDDIFSMKDTISALKDTISSLKESIASINVKLDKIDEKIDARVNKSQSETIKWAFVFWVTQLIGIFSFIMLFLKK